MPRDTKVVPPEVEAWLARARDLGFKLCFVSNNWARNVRPDAERFGAALVTGALKPLPFAIWHALRKVGARRREAVLLGDQVFTDLLGGTLAGVDTYLVRPQAAVDMPYTLVFRKFEALLLGDLEPEGRPGAESAPDGARPRP